MTYLIFNIIYSLYYIVHLYNEHDIRQYHTTLVLQENYSIIYIRVILCKMCKVVNHVLSSAINSDNRTIVGVNFTQKITLAKTLNHTKNMLFMLPIFNDLALTGCKYTKIDNGMQ